MYVDGLAASTLTPSTNMVVAVGDKEMTKACQRPSMTSGLIGSPVSPLPVITPPGSFTEPSTAIKRRRSRDGFAPR